MIERQEMVDVLAVPDTFVSGLGNVEAVGGGNWRFTFYVSQVVGGGVVPVVVAKLVMSIEDLPAAIHMAASETSTCACQNARRMVRN